MKIGSTFKLLQVLLVLLTLALIFLSSLFVIYRVYPKVFNAEYQNSWQPRVVPADLPQGPEDKKVRYGYLLISESPKWMGPQVLDPKRKFAGNNLSCQSCHLEGGTKAGAASWVGITERFPQFSGRSGKEISLADRVNGCMERSMNGKALAEDSRQMQAILAYMEWLSEGLPEDKQEYYTGFTQVAIPDFMADPLKGKQLFMQECSQCHGEEGQGTRKTDQRLGYQFPPLWGEDSYNHGAGMHRVLTAAQFIKANMPLGVASKDNPKLSDEEALHIAAYINSFDRPMKEDTELDYPDPSLKPLSTPYGPYADTFTAEQHKYGPFLPIQAFYQEKHNIIKKK